MQQGGARWLHDAALKATRTTPIVTLFQDDLVAAGLVASLARPGGNLTGIAQTTGPEIFGKRLQLLQSLASAIARVAFLGPRGVLEQDRGASHPAGITVIPVEVEFASQLGEAFATIRRDRADALMVAGSAVTYEHGPDIVAFAAENRLPAIYPNRDPVVVGGLIGYGPAFPASSARWGCSPVASSRALGPRTSRSSRQASSSCRSMPRRRRHWILRSQPTLLAIADEVVE
jgi:putative ABC transport system substrate-binding protein